ncbi:MAG: hypothetical protein SGILL_009608 [Bacillariaceae sp.]
MKSPTTPKSLDFEDVEALYADGGGDNQSESTEASEGDEDGDVEQQQVSKSSMIHKKRSKKCLIWSAVWIAVAIGLLVGLTVVFAGNGVGVTSTSTATSQHDAETPPQVPGEAAPHDQDAGYSLGEMDGMLQQNNNNNITDREESSEENDATASPPKDKDDTVVKDTPPELLEWPELMGMNGEAAKAQLEQQYPDENYFIQIVHELDPVTKDFRFDRIRLFVDDDGNVSVSPRVG